MGQYWRIPLFLLLLGNISAGAEMDDNRVREYAHVGVDTTVGQLVNHPAFERFGVHLLTRGSDRTHQEMPLRDIASLLPYHSAVDVPTIVASLNHMVDDVSDGHVIFYRFYSERERQVERDKMSTGLFFFRGKPGAPFAVICPGGGFSYVGSLHEGFPYAMELSKRGYSAFVLQYRVGGGGTPAVVDLAAARHLSSRMPTRLVFPQRGIPCGAVRLEPEWLQKSARMVRQGLAAAICQGQARS